MGRRSGVQGRAEWGVVAQQEDSIPTSVSTTFSSPQSHLVLGAPHREILLMQQTICVNGTRVMVSEGAAFVVAAQSSASFLAVGAFLALQRQLGGSICVLHHMLGGMLLLLLLLRRLLLLLLLRLWLLLWLLLPLLGSWWNLCLFKIFHRLRLIAII